MTASTESRPIAPSDRVHDVLARDEALVHVFVRHSPHFEKLRNRSMRRIMARLVTVEQAARIADVPLAALLRDLNDALGLQCGPDEPEGDVGEKNQHAHPQQAPIVELDVRADLRSGREPFSRIMSAVATMGDSDVLLLRTIFEPVPLFAVLQKRGFDHEARATAADDWSVWFWRPSSAAAMALPNDVGGADAADRAAASAIEPHDARSLILDVRDLEPPEPLTRTLVALETLPHGHTLVQVNVRVPQFLLPLLAERGFDWDVDESQTGRVLVRIWRRPSPSITPSGVHESMSTQSVELDVRIIPSREKHPAIFRAFDALESGQSLVLLNDHDPRPLRYQLAAERPDTFDWAYEAEGPELWRVRISRC
jgi:uncharacterized protein (DUF2249 family)